jgi:hypothetical protein
MKTTVKSMLVAATVAAVTIMGCKKENDIAPNPSTTGNASLSALFSEKAATKQIFTIDASQYQTIKGAKGTVLQFQPGSFINGSGQAVTGNVKIELREMYTKADMIFSKAPTVSGNQLLISGGELFVQAFQNGAALSLASANSVLAKVPTGPNPGPMREFYTSGPFETQEALNWSLADSSYTDSMFVDYDSTDYISYYYFNLDGLNWINCDYFYESEGPFTNMDVNVGPQFSGTNCEVFVSFDGMNSVASLSDYDANHLFESDSDFPQGLNVHIVAIASVNGQYYSANIPATLGAIFSTNITLTTTTLSQITTMVNTLP